MKKKMSMSFSPMSKLRRSRNQLNEIQHTNDQKLGHSLDPMPSPEEIQEQFDKVLVYYNIYISFFFFFY